MSGSFFIMRESTGAKSKWLAGGCPEIIKLRNITCNNSRSPSSKESFNPRAMTSSGGRGNFTFSIGEMGYAKTKPLLARISKSFTKFLIIK